MGQIALLFCAAGRNGEKGIREADRSQRATLTGGEDDRQRGNGGRFALFFVRRCAIIGTRNHMGGQRDAAVQ